MPESSKPTLFEKWTPAWGLAFWALVIGIVALVMLVKTGPQYEVNVEITSQDPITVEGFVRSLSDKGVALDGKVDVTVTDAVDDRTLFVKRVALDAFGQFKAVQTTIPPVPEQPELAPAEMVLKADAIYVPKGGVAQISAEKSELLGTSTDTAVRALVLLTIIVFGGVLYLTVSPPTRHRIRVLFALSHLAVLCSFLLPLGLGFFAAKDNVLAEQMKRAPVGLVEASVDGQHTDWLVRIGGELIPPTTEKAATEGAETPAVAPTASPAEPDVLPEVDEDLGALEDTSVEPTRSLPTLVGGVAVPLWALVLAAFGAAVAMAREVPELQRRCPTSRLPIGRFPSLMNQIVGGVTLGLFGAEPEAAAPRVRNEVARVRKRLMHLYLNIIAAPFLAIAVYYLIQAIGGEPPRATFVVIAFATGLVSDLFINRIKEFVKERMRGDDAAELEEAEMAVAPVAEETPSA